MAPLTILAGANSSGKSTVLQSILLISQTLSHKINSPSVVLNGDLAKLGQFDDLKSSESEANQILIGWTCRPIDDVRSDDRILSSQRSPVSYDRLKRLISRVSCEIAFDSEPFGSERDVAQIRPRLFSSAISTLTRDEDGMDRNFFLKMHRASLTSEASKQKWIDASDNNEPLTRSSLLYDVELDENSLSDIRDDLVSAEAVGCLLRHFLPNRLTIGVDNSVEDSRLILQVLRGEIARLPRYSNRDQEVKIPSPLIDFLLSEVKDIDPEAHKNLLVRLAQSPTLFGVGLNSLDDVHDAIRRLPANVRISVRRRLADSERLEALITETLNPPEEKLSVFPFRLPTPIAVACSYLDQFFSTAVRYLGPLRDEPKSLYPLSPASDPLDVGLKGEHTAAVLDLHKNRSISYIPTSGFLKDEVVPVPVTRTLQAAVIDWLRYLDIAESIESHDKGKFGHELKISMSGGGRDNDLTHVGVGVSQILPILVSSLLAERDTTLIFEQPELHLHPKVQTLLGDFFLSMTQLGKQCLLETHSEYLINRIRFRTAAAMTINPWLESVKLYFVERGTDGSLFRGVNLNEFGAIVDWPQGFFDQSQQEAEAILRAATIKRRKKREK